MERPEPAAAQAGARRRAVQLSLAAAAWTDLAKQPAVEVNGPKGLWAGVIAVNFVGPLAYLLRGRRGPVAQPPTG